MEENKAPEVIQLPKVNGGQQLSLFWLRDNCRCKNCYNHTTEQRTVDIALLPPSSFTCQYFVKDNKLHLTWGDGHKSEFDFAFIEKFCQVEKRPKIILWNGDEVERSISKISVKEFQNEGKRKLVNSLLQNGVAIVTNVEPSVTATQNVIEAVAPIYQTFYGGMWEVSETMEHNDIAYTRLKLDFHTDNTYFTDPAGLEIFHCISHDGKGGETTLVDGFSAATQLKLTDERGYRALLETKVESILMESDRHHAATGSVLSHRWGTDELEQIRFNNYDRSPRLPITTDITAFYTALRNLTRIVKKPETQWKMKLRPGNVLFINNWRVLHGRTAYTGSRKLVGAHVTMTEFLSKARILKLIT